jgi:hypothetical protein
MRPELTSGGNIPKSIRHHQSHRLEMLIRATVATGFDEHTRQPTSETAL